MKSAYVLLLMLLVQSMPVFAETYFAFAGNCRAVETEEITPFEIRFDSHTVTVIPIAEIDSFGNEIITEVKISFPLGSLLSVKLATNMPAPFNFESEVTGIMPGVSLKATLPLKLGGAVKCQGGAVERATP